MTTTKQNWPERETRTRQVAIGMGEALDYLIGIARAAGFVDIARKLDDANAELTAVRSEDSGSSPRNGASDRENQTCPTFLEQ